MSADRGAIGSMLACKERNVKMAGGIRGVGNRGKLGALSVSCFLVALAAFAAPSALAGVPELTIRSGLPDTVEPGEAFAGFITVENTGTAPFSGTVTVTDVLPAGLPLSGVEPFLNPAGICEWSGQTAVCGFEESRLLPGGQF